MKLRSNSIRVWLTLATAGCACLCSFAIAAEPADWWSLQALDSVSLNDSSRCSDEAHGKIVFGVLRAATLRELTEDSSLRQVDHQWNRARYRAVNRILGNVAVRNYWLREVARDVIDNFGTSNASDLLGAIDASCTDTAFSNEILVAAAEDSATRVGVESRVFKSVGPVSLKAFVFRPEELNTDEKRPAIVLFHGGSWYQGKADWMFGSCRHYAKLGLVAFSMEYRLFDRHGTTPLECVSDAKSAIRWVREHATEFGIDTSRIVAGGFSAGGHLAACCATLAALDESSENNAVSSVPNALLLSSACYNPTLDPWFVKQVSGRMPADLCSPLHTVRRGVPHTLILHGTRDSMCPFWTAKAFSDSMKSHGNSCSMLELVGANHFFIFDPEYRATANAEADKFLKEIGFLNHR